MNKRPNTLTQESELKIPYNDRYVNVPINLLKGIFENPNEIYWNIAVFCTYQFAVDRLRYDTLKERVKKALEFFRINKNLNEQIMQQGPALYQDWIANNFPRGGIKSKLLLDYAGNKKTEWDLIIFCVLIGLKSIIQDDSYKKTSFDALFARMAGYSSAEQAEGKIPEVILKYKSRHYRTKVIQILEDFWHLAYEADHTRGFYVSFKLNHEDLCMAIQRKKLKNKNNRIEKNQQKNESRKKAKRLFEKDFDMV